MTVICELRLKCDYCRVLSDIVEIYPYAMLRKLNVSRSVYLSGWVSHLPYGCETALDFCCDNHRIEWMEARAREGLTA